jgi:hypothetical protein
MDDAIKDWQNVLNRFAIEFEGEVDTSRLTQATLQN